MGKDINGEPKINIHDLASIKFYDWNQMYYIFSNFYDQAPFTANGIVFKTAEHYYQWQKFNDSTTQQRIIDAPTGRMAGDIALANKNIVIPQFNKSDAMLRALRAKFSQHPLLGNELKATGDRQLIEHYMYDNYWADGGDGSGLNMLGKLLMQVRLELLNGSLTYQNPFIG